MFRSTLLVILLLIAGVTVKAQDTQTEQTQPAKPRQITPGQMLSQHYAYTYQVALRYNDYNVAKDALYNLLVENPQNDSILFSLSALYFQMQQYASAALTAKDLTTRNPDHVGGLEIAANSLENLGARDKALDNYESLYLKTDDIQVLYKIAFLQYELKRYAESITNIDILLSKEELEELTAVFSSGNNEQKEYPIKVALLNLKGMVNKDQGNKEEARKFFQQALEIAPDFQLAKDNIADLDK